MFERNSLPATCSEILAAALPFITIGLLGDRLILYISLTVGIIALLGLGLCILLKNKMPFRNSVKINLQDFSLPYAIALSSAIVRSNGIDASIGFWFSLGLTVIIIIGVLIPKKGSDKQPL